MAGLAEIPAVIRDVPDEAAVAMALIENIQRENLNPLEEARAIERLVTEFALTHQEAADAVGRSRAAVSNLLRLLELADEVKALVEKRELEMGHARALLGLANRRQQAEVGALVAKKGLSVRETEALVRRMTSRTGDGQGDDGRAGGDANIRKLESDLSDKLGAKVTVKHQASGKGQLIVTYSSLDELDGILAHTSSSPVIGSPVVAPSPAAPERPPPRPRRHPPPAPRNARLATLPVGSPVPGLPRSRVRAAVAVPRGFEIQSITRAVRRG
jgi:ParB family transcriptional regulator, chromosome partitioning protein